MGIDDETVIAALIDNDDLFGIFRVVEDDLMSAFCADHLLVLLLLVAVCRRLILAVVEAAENYRETHVSLDERDQHFGLRFGYEESAEVFAGVELPHAALEFRFIVVPGKLDPDSALSTVILNGSNDGFVDTVESFVRCLDS